MLDGLLLCDMSHGGVPCPEILGYQDVGPVGMWDLQRHCQQVLVHTPDVRYVPIPLYINRGYSRRLQSCGISRWHGPRDHCELLFDSLHYKPSLDPTLSHDM